MCRRHCSFRQQLCARALALSLLLSAIGAVSAQDFQLAPVQSHAAGSDGDAISLATWSVARPDYSVAAVNSPLQLAAWIDDQAQSQDPLLAQAQVISDGERWIGPYPGESFPPPGDGFPMEPPGPGVVYFDAPPQQPWFWQVLPDGLIYRSYQAGVHEPRMHVVMFEERDGRSLWDATLGGRVGVLRYGDGNRVRPQGWQLDFEGAALMRFTFDRARDFETADYRAGAPLTYGVGNWQFKFAYYHLSSHMGDEFAIRNAGALADRINYVRDALVLGASYYPHPVVRLYSEVGYALKADGGAEPWEFQFGTELSRPGPTGRRGTPFFAFNGHLREEHDFGGDVTAQAGWLWRGCTEQTVRVGLHYFNGKSSQYQTFDDSEEQLGLAFWYDF
jgi:hypothetical protein